MAMRGDNGSDGSYPYVQGKIDMKNDNRSDGSYPYVQGKIGATGNENRSDGSLPYVSGRIRSDDEISFKHLKENDGYEKQGNSAKEIGSGTWNGNEASGGYLPPKARNNTDPIVHDKFGMLKDHHGYLILTNFDSTGNTKNREYYKPVPQPRPTDNDPTYRGFGEDTKRQGGCSRLFCLLFILLTVLLLGSVGANLYQYLQNETEEIAECPKLSCPRTVGFQAGSAATIDCTLQLTTPLNQTTIEVYLVDSIENNRHTYLSRDLVTTDGAIIQTLEGKNASVQVDFGQNDQVIVKVVFGQIRCCTQGVLSINISDFMLVKIQVIVDANTPCPLTNDHRLNALNTISCTRCFCGNSTASLLTPSNGTWFYNNKTNGKAASTEQDGRVSTQQEFSEPTGLVTYRLVFNRTACYDAGEYALLTVDPFSSEPRQLNFTLTVSADVIVDTRTSNSTVMLLTDSRIEIAACISVSHGAFLETHDISYTFIGDADSLEVLQAENTTIVVNNEGSGTIGLVPAFQQDVSLDIYDGNSLKFRTRYEAGVLYISLQFDPTQCFHSGQYRLYVNDVSLYSLNVFVDDSRQRTETTIYQLSEETGFVETYDIALECGAVVGCTKRPYMIEPAIATANMTYNHTLEDLNSDGVMDVFVATIRSDVFNISMKLNNTQFTCSVADDVLIPQNMSYTIYVLEGTFCDSRSRNCEYEYPYRTRDTCGQWVSCLDDRPRVKLCGQDTLFYNHDGSCNGRCDYGCPWYQ